MAATFRVARLPRRTLFDIPVAAVTLPQTLELIDRAISERRQLRIGVVNAAKIVKISRDTALRDAVLSSHVILADGFSVVVASRLLGTPLPERVTGIDVMCGILERGNDAQYRVYCLGATDTVLEAMRRLLATDYPGVQLVGMRNGYFAPRQEPKIAAEIAAARPDILLVGMPTPAKELFVARWGAHLDVPVCHGVGGAFDVLAGRVRRAPTSWQRSGMEWLYRLLQEPHRLWRRYLVTNVLFCQMLFVEMLRQRLLRRVHSGVPRP